MISSYIFARSVTSLLPAPASFVLCCLAASDSVAQRLEPMYMPGQFCLKGSEGSLVCFTEKSNNTPPEFLLGCPNAASIEIEVGGKKRQICLPVLPRNGERLEVDPKVFQDQQAKLSDDLRRRAEELGSRLKQLR